MIKQTSILCFLLICLGCASNKPMSSISLPNPSQPNPFWESKELDSFRVLYPKNSKTPFDQLTQKNISLGVQKARAFLQQNYTRPINVVLVDDRQQLEQIVGHATDGTALPKKDMVIEVRGVASTCHEKFHLLSLNTWGTSPLWISEGMAVACDGIWWGFELHSLTNYLMKNDKLPSLNDLFKNSNGFRKLDSRFSYPMAGSLIKFIDDTYGREKLIQLWQTGKIEASLGMEISELEVSWKKHVASFGTEKIDYLSKIID